MDSLSLIEQVPEERIKRAKAHAARGSFLGGIAPATWAGELLQKPAKPQSPVPHQSQEN